MKMRNLLALAIFGSMATSAAFAGVDLDFEAADTNLLNTATYSGSTAGITVSENLQTTTEDAYAGDQSYKLAFEWDVVTNVIDDALVRATDFTDRHVLSEPAATGGIGLWVKYDGAAGDQKIALSIREEPVNTDDNEVYETTTWKVVSGASGWQYFYWDFQTEIVSDVDPAPDQGDVNWGEYIGLGDGVYDGGGAGDAPQFEAIHLRPIEGTTAIDTIGTFYFDHVWTGPVSASTEDWMLY